MRAAKFILPVLLCGLVVSLAAGEDFWLKKPYQKWSAEETGRLLQDSPWATTLVLTNVNRTTPTINRQGVASNTATNDVETEPSVAYTLQFRSAAPIREAMVRSSQLSARYDAMNADQKAAFDANSSKFLTATFLDRVLVAVTFRSNSQNDQSLLRVYWASQNLAKMNISTFLNAGKERLSPEGYACKDDTFQLTFPRPKQLSPDSRFSVEFIHPNIDVIREQRVFLEFNLKKMMVRGESAF
jgi:hypothetical protein